MAFLLLLCLFPSVVLADAESVMRATCQIATEEKTGTGVVFTKDATNIWILTAGHIVKDQKTVKIQFFFTGQPSRVMTGTVLWCKHTTMTTSDLGVVKIKRTDFVGYPLPDAIPLEKRNYKVKEKEVILSCGCAKGGWPTLFKGCVKRLDNEYFEFDPNPLTGRSGSGIFNAQGDRIIGVIIWHNSHDAGAAISLDKIYALTDDKCNK